MIKLNDFDFLFLFVQNINDRRCCVVNFQGIKIAERLLFFFVSKIEGFWGFHIKELVEISSTALVDNFVGDESGGGVRFGV